MLLPQSDVEVVAADHVSFVVNVIDARIRVRVVDIFDVERALWPDHDYISVVTAEDIGLIDDIAVAIFQSEFDIALLVDEAVFAERAPVPLDPL